MSEKTIDTAVDLGLEGAVDPVPASAVLQRRPWLGILRNALRLGRTRIGLAIVALVVVVAVFGPLVAPHSPTEFIAVPNSGPVRRGAVRRRRAGPRRVVAASSTAASPCSGCRPPRPCSAWSWA